ncbi:MAG: putative pit accessory protein [Actinobacteria bacterium ADurb.Bin346]|nr:MAG: putative pit accessory protein [Actinobacteria bacterium ADurb.Bin346]
MKLFRKRKNIFLKLLIDQAQKAKEVTEFLTEYLKIKDSNLAKEIEIKEKEGDEIRRILIDEINRTFSTPFDREDIFALSRAIDDIIDYTNTTVDEMDILKIESNDYLIEMSEILKKSAFRIYQAVNIIMTYPRVANEHIVKVKSFENRLEKLYRSAISDLFITPSDLNGVIHILKMREIYRHISNAGDRCDEAANILGDIIVKNF